MNSFLFATNAVLPLVLLILLGWFLNKTGLASESFFNVGNKLTFRVFLPILLFRNVYNVEDIREIDWHFVLFGILAVLAVFFLGTLLVIFTVKRRDQRGVLIQVIYRSNFALIGLPLATALFGEGGLAIAGVFSAFTIPLFNILAVIILSIYGEQKDVSVRRILLSVLKNPLFIAVGAGLCCVALRGCFVQLGWNFRLSNITFLFEALEDASAIATPLALIVLGGKFRMQAVKSLWRQILFGTLMRTVVVPAVVLSVAYFFFDFSGAHFATLIAAFGTPAAVSSAVMVKEMGGDDELAGQLVVFTTLVSGITIFLEIVILRSIGIF